MATRIPPDTSVPPTQRLRTPAGTRLRGSSPPGRRRILLGAHVALLLGTLGWSPACDSGTEPEQEPPRNTVGPDGGTIAVQNLRLVIPAGALSESVVITLEPLSEVSGAVPQGFLAVDGTGFDLGPDGLAFQQPATLSIEYEESDIPAGVGETELRMLRFGDGASVIASTVDPAARVVEARIEHFSSFAVGLQSALDRIACPDLGPAATSGIPLDRVALGRVPAELEPPLAVKATAEDTLLSYGIVELDEKGAAELVLPIHPSASPEGGLVRLIVTDGTRGCPGFEFTVDPLPPAPGELGLVTDRLQEVLRRQAAALGTTPEELVSTPVAELPDVLIPLALAQSVVDHPQNDRSLRAMADGTWPGADDARLDLIEPLLSRTGLRSALQTSAAVRGDSRADGELSRPSAVSARTCQPEGIGDDAGLLDTCMDAAASAAFELEGASGKVLTDLSSFLGYLGLVPALGTGTAIGGAVTWSVLNEKQRTAALLPSALAKMTVSFDKTEFLEDEEGTGIWSEARVTATSRAWDMGKEALEAALQAAGLLAIGDKLEVGGPKVNEILGAVLTGPVASELLEGGTIEEFRIPPLIFGPVDVTPEPWSASKVVGTAVKRSSRREYAPVEPGIATLSVRTADGEFGGQQIAVHQEVEVKRIRLTISPGSVVLEPSETFTFTAMVENSALPEKVEASARLGVATATYLGGDEHEILYTAPPEEEFEDFITVESTSNTGARATSAERRLAVADASSKKRITVTPFAACVDTDGTQAFTAEVLGESDPPVTWAVIEGGGSIGSDGVYRAPGQPGTARVQATAVADPSLQADAGVTVGGCDCWWSVQVANTVYGRPQLSNVSGSYSYADRELLNILGSGTDGASVTTVGGFGLVPGSSSGLPVRLGPGTWEAAATGSVTDPSGALSFELDTLPPITLALLEADSGKVEGNAFGTVVVTRDDGSEPVTSGLNIAFRFSADSLLRQVQGDTVAASCVYPPLGG